MDILSKIGVQTMKAIKGQTGLYFKFANAQCSNGSPTELYFKPKFVEAPYEVEEAQLKKITWIEINILWVGSNPPENLENGWKVARDGDYHTKEGLKMKGYLLGKVYLPMGEFNGVLPELHKWLSDKAQFISDFIQESLGKQVYASPYMPMKTIFDHMLEQVQNDALQIQSPQIYLFKGWVQYQQAIKKAVEEKYSHSAPGNDEPEQDDENGED